MFTLPKLKQILSLYWFSVDYFLYGWSFFIQEEIANLGFWFFIALIGNVLFGGTILSFFSLCILAVLFRRVMAGGICLSQKRFDGKTVIITGANSGIGKETAKEMALRGAKVIMACRDIQKAEVIAQEIRKLADAPIKVVKLDLASLASVRRFAAEIISQEKVVHCLINNAGVMFCPYELTEDGFEMHMAINHLGHYLLTRLLLPLLIGEHEARVITVSSLFHIYGKIPFEDFQYKKGYGIRSGYANSKLANILFTRKLAKELKGSNVQVFSLHPGAVQSDLSRSLPFLINYLHLHIFQLISKTTAEGAHTSVYCATEAVQEPPYYYSDCTTRQPARRATDDEIADKLWDVSAKLVHFEEK